MTGAAPAQPALACGGNQVGILGKGHYCIGRTGEPPRAPSQTASPFPHGIAVALAPCEPRGVRFSFACADKQLSPGDRQTEERKNHVRPDVTPRLHGRRSNRSLRARGLLQHLREFREIERKGEGREAGHPRHELRHELQRLAPHHHRRHRRRYPREVLAGLRHPPRLHRADHHRQAEEARRHHDRQHDRGARPLRGRRREGNRRAADASHGWPGIRRRERRARQVRRQVRQDLARRPAAHLRRRLQEGVRSH